MNKHAHNAFGMSSESYYYRVAQATAVPQPSELGSLMAIDARDGLRASEHGGGWLVSAADAGGLQLSSSRLRHMWLTHEPDTITVAGAFALKQFEHTARPYALFRIPRTKLRDALINLGWELVPSPVEGDPEQVRLQPAPGKAHRLDLASMTAPYFKCAYDSCGSAPSLDTLTPLWDFAGVVKADSAAVRAWEIIDDLPAQEPVTITVAFVLYETTCEAGAEACVAANLLAESLLQHVRASGAFADWYLTRTPRERTFLMACLHAFGIHCSADGLSDMNAAVDTIRALGFP